MEQLLKRKVDSVLLEWKYRDGHKPLIVKGARQVGKTRSVSAFAEAHYESIYSITMKRLILFYIAVWYTLLLKSQPAFQVTDYSTENGLSQDLVSAVIQDHHGFIWIATRNGLNKYDGYTFKHYKSDSYSDNPLSNNRIIKKT